MKSISHFVTVLSLATATASVAAQVDEPPSTAPSNEAMQMRIAQLEREVASLREMAGPDWLTEQRAHEIRGLVHDVLADADTRSSLLQSGLTAGWNEGFFVGSEDSNFMLRVNGQLQFRFVYNNQDDLATDSDRWGFENTRTKLRFSGNVVDPSWIYYIEGNFDRSGGAFGLEDAYIGHAFGDSGFVFVAGQFRVPMLREELVHSSKQLLVERSLVNEEFTAGRTQGVALDYRNDVVHFVGGYTDGHPATGGFNMPALMADVEYSFTARGELLLDGDWSQFNDLTSWRGEDFGLMLGAAIHYQMGEYGTAADELEVLQWTADVSVECSGANLLAYVVGRHLDSMTVGSDQFGAVVQGGVFVTDDWELFARYEWGDDDSAAEDLSVITVGANRYISGHDLKWTIDAGYGLNEVTGTWGAGSLGGGGDIAGWRTDPGTEDGQLVVRTQLQLLF